MTIHCDTAVSNPAGVAQAKASSPSKAGAREWLGLALLALPTILLGLDLTLLYLALPPLAADLQPTSTQSLWIMDAYGFMIAGFLITMGTLGDQIGRCKLLMIGAAAFAVASVFAAFSTSAIMLIAARAALGIAGATLMPSTLALISNLFADPRERALGFGIWATMFALGMAMGPVVGGALLEQFWWGAAFQLAVPIVVLLLILAPILLPEYRAPNAGRIDLVSVALSLAAMLPVIYGIKQIAKYGFAPAAITAILVGIGVAVLFVRRQKKLSDPLLDMSLFGNRAFSVALIVLLFGLIAVGGTMLLVTQYLQLVAGFSPLVRACGWDRRRSPWSPPVLVRRSSRDTTGRASWWPERSLCRLSAIGCSPNWARTRPPLGWSSLVFRLPISALAPSPRSAPVLSSDRLQPCQRPSRIWVSRSASPSSAASPQPSIGA